MIYDATKSFSVTLYFDAIRSVTVIDAQLGLLGKVEKWTLVKFKSGLWGTPSMDR